MLAQFPILLQIRLLLNNPLLPMRAIWSIQLRNLTSSKSSRPKSKISKTWLLLPLQRMKMTIYTKTSLLRQIWITNTAVCLLSTILTNLIIKPQAKLNHPWEGTATRISPAWLTCLLMGLITTSCQRFWQRSRQRLPLERIHQIWVRSAVLTRWVKTTNLEDCWVRALMLWSDSQ